jgi:hypothetical protein
MRTSTFFSLRWAGCVLSFRVNRIFRYLGCERGLRRRYVTNASPANPIIRSWSRSTALGRRRLALSIWPPETLRHRMDGSGSECCTWPRRERPESSGDNENWWCKNPYPCSRDRRCGQARTVAHRRRDVRLCQKRSKDSSKSPSEDFRPDCRVF